MGTIPGSRRSPRAGHGNPLQYCYQENPMDRGAWRAAVHRVAKGQTRLKQFSIHICTIAAAAAKSLQSCPTLCDPIDGSPPGSPVPGILQARTLKWVAIFFSNAWKWQVKVKSLSPVWLFATPWTAAHQAPPSMGFSRQEYWSGVPLPSPCTWGFVKYPYHWIFVFKCTLLENTNYRFTLCYEGPPETHYKIVTIAIMDLIQRMMTKDLSRVRHHSEHSKMHYLV